MELIGQGGECHVWKTDDGSIFKEYQTKIDAKDAQNWQMELSYYNLAPDVYSRVTRIKTPDGLSGWGYYTEEAETFTEEEIELDCENITNPEIEEERLDVDYRLLMFTGFEYTDFHLGNYGYVERDGKKVMVIIDTTNRSFCDGVEPEAIV